MSCTFYSGSENRGTVTLSDEKDLSLNDFVRVINGERIAIEEATLSRMDRASAIARRNAANTELYGFSTGLGPMVGVGVPTDGTTELQYNLVRSHAAGMGELLSREVSLGIMLARLQSFTRNRSAVGSALANHIVDLMNANLAPCVPRKGGVGASGDLVQLAHLGLLIIGEGECWQGEQRVAASAAYADTGIQPYELKFRDGLALVNGTSAMVSMGVQACRSARQLFESAIACSCILVEIVGASMEAYALPVHEAKQHPAQLDVARRMQVHFADRFCSERTSARAKLQMPYSLRCVPQIIGPMFETLAFAQRALLRELNSASDNPVFDPQTGEALHGGNFHGEAVALALDVLKISVIKCSLLMERQINFVLNDCINGILPPFVNLGRLGIELGMQGAQFTATSTAAENQSLAFPVSVHSLSSNKDNQDVVSMGANAAWLTLCTIGNAFDIAGILAMALSQGAAAARSEASLSMRSRKLIEEFRRIAPVFTTDRPLSTALTALSEVMRHIDFSGGKADEVSV